VACVGGSFKYALGFLESARRPAPFSHARDSLQAPSRTYRPLMQVAGHAILRPGQYELHTLQRSARFAARLRCTRATTKRGSMSCAKQIML
jgi:hypothetical protein